MKADDLTECELDVVAAIDRLAVTSRGLLRCITGDPNHAIHDLLRVSDSLAEASQHAKDLAGLIRFSRGGI